MPRATPQPRTSSTRRARADRPRLMKVLREVFQHERLRPGQLPVIERVLDGDSTLAVMPTGAGKSLCYQLPAVLMPGLTLVVSPLIALMKDQCEKLQALGVHAVQFNSQVPTEEIEAAERSLADGSAQIVLTTPERLADAAFLGKLRERPISLLVVDEAHCISQWGHDFRPAFLEIGPALKSLGQPIVLALTATANDAVAKDIRERLGIPKSGLLDTGTFRPNLRYAVEQFASEAEKLERARQFVLATDGSGIVYAATIKAAETLHDMLAGADVSVGLYHGKRKADERRAAQEAFMQGRVRVMVATNAFGMGIDKPDIRFVLHYQMPSGLDAYYQESGRAGRDGADSYCTLLFLQKDKAVQQFFMAGRYPELKDLDALYRGLHQTPTEGSQWSLPELKRAVDIPASKLQVALSLLVQQKVVSRDKSGRLRVLKSELSAETLESLVATYRDRRDQDRDTLERMVFYAQTGQCRWQVLLAHLEEESPAERCGHCDNCRRIARHEAAITAPIVIDPHEPVLRQAAAPRMPEPVFVPHDPVKVKRYGKGLVVSADAVSVTIEFADGTRRCFQPQFVEPALKRRAAGVAAVAGVASAEVSEIAEAALPA